MFFFYSKRSGQEKKKHNRRLRFLKEEEEEATRPLRRPSPEGRPPAPRVRNQMLHLSSAAEMDFPPRDLGVERLLPWRRLAPALPRSRC